ncbi:J domain-containing protein [Candidatus Synechococcus calcipolaris G9]|uniref:J domain-containing protein n=1 Tax=Candidatus Synechococcus calcipolaris G9 TaxID=1497997 RepID=A0ABT6EX99_9SYNE|nr:J domain-containing protein [Candidatus Synechococcus calcipolaris]MDG2989733.1 J domain-containing protein [Candidatus Synechococcus calcipolaris G9]
MASTDFKDYYQILGVAKTATEKEIRTAFKRLARKYHPDLNPGDLSAEEKFKEINEAHEVLSDPEKRQKYDQFGRYWQQASPDAGTPGSGFGFDVGGFNVSGFDGDFSRYANFDEFINELLGNFAGQGAAPGGTWGASPYGSSSTGVPGSDIEGDVRLSFPEAFQGTEKQFQIGTEKVTVRIPAGVKPGSRIRLKGKGNVNPLGQVRGDLYLKVILEPHPLFRFEDEQLVFDLPLAADEAALGTQLDIPTPSGTVKLNIPSGTKSGQLLRLKGKGWPQAKGVQGDLIAKIQIVPPKPLSEPERELYEKLSHLRTMDPRAQMPKVF